jgi:ATP-dependent Lon protease
VLAAERAGLRRVILPHENEPDLEELPDETRAELAFVPVDTMQEVLEHVFEQPRRARRPSRRAALERQAASPARLRGQANGNTQT